MRQLYCKINVFDETQEVAKERWWTKFRFRMIMIRIK